MNDNRSGDDLTYLDDKRAIRLKNETCPFCGARLTSVPSDEDHVIGRRFVPKGVLKSSWNLVVRACKGCNGRKSALEGDISAITMQPDAFGQVARADSRLLAAPFLGGHFRFDAVAPPQVDDNRAFELAHMQLAAFFYWITFDRKTGKGGFWPGGFHPPPYVTRHDRGMRG
jgi:hypothetical protein